MDNTLAGTIYVISWVAFTYCIYGMARWQDKDAREYICGLSAFFIGVGASILAEEQWGNAFGIISGVVFFVVNGLLYNLLRIQQKNEAYEQAHGPLQEPNRLPTVEDVWAIEREMERAKREKD